MKKIYIVLLAAAAIVCTDAAANSFEAMPESPKQKREKSADGNYAKPKKGALDRKKNIIIGYSQQTLSPEFGNEFKSDFGAFFGSTRNIYLHRKPVAGLMKFAIDLGSDINYVKYKDQEGDYNFGNGYDDYDELEDMGLHHIDIGIPVGPSVAINPVKHLRIDAYFHFVPSYSMLLLDDSFNSAFSPIFKCGGEVSYKVIGIGVEARFGNAKYKDLMSDPNDETADPVKMKYKTNGVRFYINFKF